MFDDPFAQRKYGGQQMQQVQPMQQMQQVQVLQRPIQQQVQQQAAPALAPDAAPPGGRWASASAAVLRRTRDAFREQHRADGSPIALVRAASCVAFLGEDLGWQDWTLAFGLLDLRRRSAEKASDSERVHDLALVELDLLLDLVDQNRWKVEEWRAALGRAIGHESAEACVRSLLRNGRPDAYVFHAFYRQLLRFRLFVPQLEPRVQGLLALLREHGVATRWTAIREWMEEG